MTIEIPDELARNLEDLAALQDKTVEQLTIERLRSLFEDRSNPQVLLRNLRALPHPSAAAVNDMEAAIAASHVPIREEGVFDDLK